MASSGPIGIIFYHIIPKKKSKTFFVKLHKLTPAGIIIWQDMLRSHLSNYTNEIVHKNHVIILECGQKLAQAFWQDMLRPHLSNYADKIVRKNHVIILETQMLSSNHG